MSELNEEWRAALGGNYEVSSLGRVRRATPGRRTYAGRVMSPALHATGYLSVAPTVDGRNRVKLVHHLVAEAFLGPRPAGAEINHRDGVKTHNAASNLEYVTHTENMRHAFAAGLVPVGEAAAGAKLSDAQVRELCAARAEGLSYSRLAERFGICIAHAFNLVNGRSRTRATAHRRVGS